MKFLYNKLELKTRRRDLRNNMPQPEQILWYYLRGKNLKNYKFRRQYSIGNFILDFFCPKLKLGIEVDGDSHFNSKSVEYDTIRDKFLDSQNIKLLRFTNQDVTDNIEAVVEKILQYLP